jgi:hypothetical protein
LLEHPFVEQQLSHELLEAIDLELQLATLTIAVDQVGGVLLSLAIIRALRDALFATDASDR